MVTLEKLIYLPPLPAGRDLSLLRDFVLISNVGRLIIRSSAYRGNKGVLDARSAGFASMPEMLSRGMQIIGPCRPFRAINAGPGRTLSTKLATACQVRGRLGEIWQ